MRFPRDILTTSVYLTLPSLISAINIDCSNVVVEKQRYNLSPLAGEHTVHWINRIPPTLSNFTFTIDLCAPLVPPKDVPTADKCPSGANVCGIEYRYNPAEGSHMIGRVVPIAGNFEHDGRHLDPRWMRINESASDPDAKMEGLSLELNGGKYPFRAKDGMPQKAIVEFWCDQEKTGLEGDKKDKREEEESEAERRSLDGSAEDGDDGKDDDELPNPDEGKSLRFVSYKPEGEKKVGTLRLQWRTKHACVDQSDKKPSDEDPVPAKSKHWGFFTWFIIILFLAISAYLIFGSWLNYNRYGARGWDLLPHGDTIRDIPYLMKDWGRRMVSTVQGGGSRGGYSAV